MQKVTQNHRNLTLSAGKFYEGSLKLDWIRTEISLRRLVRFKQ